MTKVKWSSGPDFAELAEALAIKTDQIVCAMVEETIVVFFTPDSTGRLPIFRASLERDADGILVVKGAPKKVNLPPELHGLLGGDNG